MSEVTICNLALSYLGDAATVASIKPPDSSRQAQLCAKFYWVARNALLEMSAWGFATRRVKLAQLYPKPGADPSEPWPHWAHPWRRVYALPNAMINALAVVPHDAPDDYQAFDWPLEGDRFVPYPEGRGYSEHGYEGLPAPGAPVTVPQPFAIETLESGAQVVLTNVPDAMLRYTTLVEDTTKFSPLFTVALSRLLASMLAGPLIKGDEGRAASTEQLEIFETFKAQASTSDANQRKTHVEAAPSWIRGR